MGVAQSASQLGLLASSLTTSRWLAGLHLQAGRLIRWQYSSATLEKGTSARSGWLIYICSLTPK